MKIINFTGTYLSQAQIKKMDKNNKYVKHDVSFVQIHPTNNNDISTLKKTSKIWEDKPSLLSFANMIYEDAKNIHDEEFDTGIHKFYALTNQKNNFEKLLPNEILGLTEVTHYPKSTKMNIDLLEVHPEYNYLSENSNYKKVVEALINNIKNIFEGKEITVRAISSALDFYIKNGFKQIQKNSLDLHYIK